MGGQGMWAGVDIGKAAHHCVVIDEAGNRVLSQRVRNDEPSLTGLVDAVTALQAHPIVWAVDSKGELATTLLTLLHHRGLRVVYLCGRAFHYSAQTYAGERKTDARDAAIIADQARQRNDLPVLTPCDDVTVALRALLSHRAGVSADRVRAINRLRALLSGLSPALEAAFSFAQNKGAVVLLTGFPSAAAIHAASDTAILDWLSGRARKADTLLAAARAAADRQAIELPGRIVLEDLVREQAATVLDLQARMQGLDKTITSRFRTHPYAAILESMPGFGPHLGAAFTVGIDGSIHTYPTASRLAAACGLVPIPHDSGSIKNNHRRPRYYDRQLLRACYRSAESAARYDPRATSFYQRKRAEGKVHQQAVIALARRRVDVLWAMLRDGTHYRYSVPEGSEAASGNGTA